MDTRKEIVSGFYDQIDEDARLQRTRHGQLEYFTTMAYIHRYLKENAKVLEIGAGTGRYSLALANEGYDVTAVELVESNLAVLRENSKGTEHIRSYQGDATDLGRFPSDTFDLTLVLGPMYHLYEPNEVEKANEDYCKYCYEKGEFTAKVSMEEFIKMCSQFGGQAGMTGEEMKAYCEKLFPTLKRWKQ